jgi:hypothetical protein
MTDTTPETENQEGHEPFPWDAGYRSSGTITAEQYAYLMNPLRSARVATRQQGGKTLSYLEAWDVKAHLTRIFGFGNWDLNMLEQEHVATRPYLNDAGKDMVEVVWMAKMMLTVRDNQGREIATHSEAAVGSASGPASMLGDHHDNALKTAASDATKRCAINWGTQFGLSLYDNGAKTDVIKQTLVKPDGVVVSEEKRTEEQVANIQATLGGTVIEETEIEEPNPDHTETVQS